MPTCVSGFAAEIEIWLRHIVRLEFNGRVCVCVRVCMCVHVRVRVLVCVCLREEERERESHSSDGVVSQALLLVLLLSALLPCSFYAGSPGAGQWPGVQQSRCDRIGALDMV